MNNNTTPTVSVIIPCYNCADWIVKCLSELENQSYKDFEVVCVDDCSDDDTCGIISGYKTKSSMPINLLKNDVNSGPAVSRNKAVSVARGEWLAFCDSDDYYDRTFIEEMLAKAREDNSDVVMCEYRKIYESGKAPTEVNYLRDIENDACAEKKIVFSKASLCLLLIKKQLFSGNLIPDLRNGEDIACIPCIEAKASGISVVKKVLYNYLIRSTSVSNKPSHDIYKSLCSSFEYIEKNFNSRYRAALEYIGIRTVLYGVTINAFKAGIPSPEIKEIVNGFEKKYPQWRKNKYLSNFSKAKRLYLKLIDKNMYAMCRALAYVHTKIST